MHPIPKNLLIPALLFLTSIIAGAADTLKIDITFKHKLDSTGHSTGYITINQKFHSYDGILFREISYDDNTSQLSGYTFYFYSNGRLFTEESYDVHNNLLQILKHEYDATGNEVALSKMIPGSNGLSLAEKTVKSYNGARKVVQQKKYSGKQIGALTRYKYDESGLLISEKTTFKPVAKAPFKLETREYSYGTENRISQIMVSQKDMSGKITQYREEYSYDDNGLVSSIKKFNNVSTPAGEKKYKYLKSGTISYYEEYNAGGKLMLLLQYDYKKHFMDKGTQVSYYENH